MIYSDGTHIYIYKLKFMYTVDDVEYVKFNNTEEMFKSELASELFPYFDKNKDDISKLMLPNYIIEHNILNEVEQERFNEIKQYSDLNLKEVLKFIKGEIDVITNKDYKIDKLKEDNMNLELVIMELYEGYMSDIEDMKADINTIRKI